MALYVEAMRVFNNAAMYSASNGYIFPTAVGKIEWEKYDVIYCALGCGSVSEAKENPLQAVASLVSTPLACLLKSQEKTAIVAFSSDYCASENSPSVPTLKASPPLSLYAKYKLWLEDAFEFQNRPKSAVIRVGSLYGTHKPKMNLAEKLRANFRYPCEVTLPKNKIGPTPTKWVAEEVIEMTKQGLFHSCAGKVFHCGPSTNTTVAEFGEWALGRKYTVKTGPFDPERPKKSLLTNTLRLEGQADWWEMWEKYVPKD